jgi:hypothetical protein
MEILFQKARFKIAEDFLSDDHISRVIQKLAKESADKSPGAVFERKCGGKNEIVFKTYGCDAIKLMVKERLTQYLETEDSRYIAAPLKLFIKNEPHSWKKQQQQRWRLIWCVDLIDQIIDRLLWQEMIDATINNHTGTPSKVGMSFQYGGIDKMVKQYSNNSRKWRSFDVSGHDMSAAAFVIEDITKLNQQLCISVANPHLSKWVLLGEKRLQSVLYGTFSFSDGLTLRKIKPGLQISGHLCTIDNNSKYLVYLRVLCDIMNDQPTQENCIVTMGDDNVQDFEGSKYDAEYLVDFCKTFGTILTIESDYGTFDQQNFCSMDFIKREGMWVGKTRNIRKNLCALAHQKPEVMGQTLLSDCLNLVWDPIFPKIHAKLAEYPDLFKSEKQLKNIWFGYEADSRSN